MRKEEIEKIIEKLTADYLNGLMNQQQEQRYKELFKEGGFDPGTLSEMEELYKDLKLVKVPEPSEKMHRRFYESLEGYKNTQKSSIFESIRDLFANINYPKLFPKLAYGFSLLVIGGLIGAWITPETAYEERINSMHSEIKDMKKMMMLTLIDKPSASERIKAVRISSEFENVDDNIATALLKTLNQDPNVNVRLVAAEALYEFADNPKVREGLIQSISKQESPVLQLTLADIMIALQEKRSVDQFKKLLEKKDIDYVVRNRIEETLKILL